MTTTVIKRKWHTTAEVAEMLGFGLSKTKMLVLTGEIRSDEGRPQPPHPPGWVDEYVERRARRRRKVGGMSGKRGNGEGSIYPYKNGYAAYVWVTKPDGKRARKYATARPAKRSTRSGSSSMRRRRRARSPPVTGRSPPSSRTGSTRS